MEIRVKGLVVGETKLGDNKKYIRVLTDTLGTVSVIVYGAGSVKSKYMSAVKPFSYSNFLLTKKGEGYTLKEAALEKSFFMLGSDPKKLALASYIVNVSEHVSSMGEDGGELLSLTLNALYVLCETDRPEATVKAAFELKCAAVTGFAPSLIACSACGCEVSDGGVLFRIYDGNIVCRDCAEKAPANEYEITYSISASVLAAMRYITYSPIKKVFSFSLDSFEMATLSDLSEKYLLTRTETDFPALRIYKSL